MNWPSWLGPALLLIIFGLLLALPLAMILKRRPRGQTGRFVKKALLTENEKEFFARLIRAVPEFHVYPQVALSAILKVEAGDYKEKNRLRNKFAQKYADFIVTDQALNILAVVELDDKTHNRERDKARDAMLNAAGYATLRYHSRNKPRPEKIRSDLIAAGRFQ